MDRVGVFCQLSFYANLLEFVMTIKLNENQDNAEISIWLAHPLIINSMSLLPNRVLSILSPDIVNGYGTVKLEVVPADNITSFIDYRLHQMRTKLTSIQLKNKFVTTFMCFFVGMVVWSFLFHLNADVVMTSLIGAITVVTMTSLFARRFIVTTRQDKALNNISTYLIKEHQYLYESLYKELSASNLKLGSLLTQYNSSVESFKSNKATQDDCITNLEQMLHDERLTRNNLTSIYSDLLNNCDPTIIEEHFDRCRKYGLELEFETNVVDMLSNTVH